MLKKPFFHINEETLALSHLSLSREDDKRISINGIDSLAMGHYKVLGCE